MVEKFMEKFQELREDYKVTKNPDEDFVFWYIHRVAPFNFRYVVAVGMILCMAAIYFNIQYVLAIVGILWIISAAIMLYGLFKGRMKQ